MNEYVQRVIHNTCEKHKDQPEFLQSVTEVLKTIEPVVKAHPEYEKAALLERLVEPERQILFRVVWNDDKGEVHVNTGYRIQFNGVLGPYKGGLRFHPSVNLSVLKFLGFEQTFKNSLTTLAIGGGKGGSDFDPHGKSDAEIMRFCQAFMTELYRHIGPNTDVPAGDIGVGGREIGYLFGQYRRIRDSFDNGVLTGKGLTFGGSLIRPEATGFGVLYYIQRVFEHEGLVLKGKTIAVSGYGNVAWGVCKKATELGAKVVTISGHNGYVYDPEGIDTKEKINFLLEMRASQNANVKMYADKFGCAFMEGKKPWEVKVDICIPCATQNEVDLSVAEIMVQNGTQYYFEGANMPATNEAIAYLQGNGVLVGPAKAANAGGVAVSALEMSQNSERLSWSCEEVDQKLREIMYNIVDVSYQASERYGLKRDLVSGANIAGFEKVAEAMMAQGLI
ncbi:MULTISPECIES: NADP-specific glutamate dehydrogenase [Terrabacteria group]|uniref:NADP-specific glutamate dehydrogenase n=1 Tax=Bacillati TaxID=1783272 RepID=UPI001C6EEEAC|nr:MULTISPECIES: NADP-specific glutamate dehydrogenase [Terrabacteria group]MBW9212473.1 NADP-specific glutamate dehydrogenase [Trueperella sp. zg.1013]